MAALIIQSTATGRTRQHKHYRNQTYSKKPLTHGVHEYVFCSHLGKSVISGNGQHFQAFLDLTDLIGQFWKCLKALVITRNEMIQKLPLDISGNDFIKPTSEYLFFCKTIENRTVFREISHFQKCMKMLAISGND